MTRKRIIAALVWAGAMAAAIAYMTCGNDSSHAPKGAMKRCQLVVSAKAITVDAKETNAVAAVEYCKRVGGAEIYVGSDARRTDVLQIQGALTNSKVDVLTHGLK